MEREENMELKVILGINGRETDKYELQTLVVDIRKNELLILLKNKEPNKSNFGSNNN